MKNLTDAMFTTSAVSPEPSPPLTFDALAKMIDAIDAMPPPLLAVCIHASKMDATLAAIRKVATPTEPMPGGMPDLAGTPVVGFTEWPSAEIREMIRSRRGVLIVFTEDGRMLRGPAERLATNDLPLPMDDPLAFPMFPIRQTRRWSGYGVFSVE